MPLVAAAWLALDAQWSPTSAFAAEPAVALEIVTEPNLPIDAAQRWYKTLTDLGIDGLQIRSAASGDKPSVTKTGGSGYRVVGVLSGDNRLTLPGGTFRMGDAAGLRAWLDKLREGGAEGVTQERSAFDLLPSQLQQVTSDLKRPVAFAALGRPADDVVRQIAGTLEFPLQLDPSSRAVLQNASVADEVQGLAAGTALAILLRPAGLVLVPERSDGGKLQYRMRKATRGMQAWPVGWKSEKRSSELVPRLFEFLNVEIADIGVTEAVLAIQDRLQTPLFYDRNALALHGIDPAGVTAELPSKRISYSQTLSRVLAQARLKYELRVDEAERPFLWVTTFKPVE